MTFKELNLNASLLKALEDQEISEPTPIQERAFTKILSGRDLVGIAQTGTGKTLAYLLPLLKMLSFPTQKDPRILILVPTRELVLQVSKEIKKLTEHSEIRTAAIYGGTNINTQKKLVAEGTDIIVATPGRLYDLTINRDLHLRAVQKLVIDEVDVMLDLGFRFQLNNILELLPSGRQNIMFSATMTVEVEQLIRSNFRNPEKVSVAKSGTPLDNISQSCYELPNFNTRINLLIHILADKEEYTKVLIFTANKKQADMVFERLDTVFTDECTVIHSNKTQNYRLRSIRQFADGFCRILIATDVMARGLDIEQISDVINFDTPAFPENYIHRIGRTGRADKKGRTILLTSPDESEYLEEIEALMEMKIPKLEVPSPVEISTVLIPEEQPDIPELNNPTKRSDEYTPGASHHEKSAKNSKVNLGGSYRREISKKYKKPKTRGDKNYNRRKKR